MTTWITICDTCKRPQFDPESCPSTDGALLAGLIEEAAAGTALRTRRTSCLMGCSHGCNVAVQARGKLNYTIGNFEATAEAAEAIVEWARLHAESETGQVPYRLWPQPIKGHFVTRHPPLPAED